MRQANASELPNVFVVFFGVKYRMRTASVECTCLAEVLQWIEAGRGNVGVLFEIPPGIEERMRIAPFTCPVGEIMRQGIYPQGGDLGVLFEIPSSIEERIRIVAPFPAEVEKMNGSIDRTFC